MFCSLADLEERFGAKLQGWSPSSEAIEETIKDVDSEIEAALVSGGYAIPLASIPKLLRKIAIDCVASALLVRSGIFDDAMTGDKAIVEQAKDSRRLLLAIAQGRFKLALAAASDAGMFSHRLAISARARLSLRGFV